MRIILFTLLLLFLSCSVTTHATTTVTCVPIIKKTEDKMLILAGPTSDQSRATQIYFLKNISEKSLWIDHPVKKRSASAGWATYIQPGKWAALLLNQKNFALTCAAILPGHVDSLDCSKKLSVCTPDKAVFESKRKGSYWLTEDVVWEDLLKGVEKRGVVFKK